MEKAYATDIEWHAWLLYWLVSDNSTAGKGCFYGSHLDTIEKHRLMSHYIAYEKRQRSRHAKSFKQKKTATPHTKDDTASDEASSSEEDFEMDSNKGTAIVRWGSSMPTDLAEEDAVDKIKVPKFCGYTLMQFIQETDARFELSKLKQRRVGLCEKDGLSFKRAQLKAFTSEKPVLFILDTEDTEIPEEMQPVPESEVPALSDGDEELEAENRNLMWRTMVLEAGHKKANRFDMGVRLWQYNLMLAEARTDNHVRMRDIVLDLGNDHEEEQAIRVSYSHRLSYLLSYLPT